MLCKLGDPFESDTHLFEIKWDGTRGIAFIENGRYHARQIAAHVARGEAPALDLQARRWKTAE